MKIRNIGITAAAVATGFVLITLSSRDSYEDKQIYNTSIRSLTENRKDKNTILDNEDYRKELKEFEQAYYGIEKIGELDFIKEGYEYDIDDYTKSEAEEFTLADIALGVDGFPDMKLDDYRRLRMKNELAYLYDKYKNWFLDKGYDSVSILMKQLVSSEVCSTFDEDYTNCKFIKYRDESIIPYIEIDHKGEVIMIDYRSGNLYKMGKSADLFDGRKTDSFKDVYKDMGKAMKLIKKSIGTESVNEDGIIKTR